jgi:UDP-2,4-diacetamido-2,4,6-trideoxy-beta-L-altropyranose hydrolase
VHVIFRTDSSLEIGSGHIRRCLALATALATKGASCTFIARALPGNTNELVRRAGHTLIELQGIAANQEADAAESLAAIAPLSPAALLVVDHYDLDQTWESRLRSAARRCAVIDDLANRAHDCDALIDVTGGEARAERYALLVPADALLLLGPRYALLRPEFRSARGAAGLRTHVHRVLISFGAIDAGNHSAAAWRAVRRACAGDVGIDIVLGGNAPHRATLATAIQSHRNTRLHVDAPDMARLMTDADLAIGAGGTTSWERACLGLPAIVTMIADNQRDNIGVLELAGVARSVLPGSGYEERLVEAITKLQSAPDQLAGMSAAASRLVDGRGAQRLANVLARPDASLRPARPDDSRRVWQWRNDPHIRSFSNNPTPISWEEHGAWFEAALARPHQSLLIGEADHVPVGVLRFDVEGDEATVSLYLTPDGRGRGLGPELLLRGSEWLRSNRPTVHRIKARIQPSNEASIAAFTAARYRRMGDLYVRDLAHDSAKTH